MFGGPAAGEFLQSGHIDVTVVEVALHARKPAGHEAAVLADRIAAHRALAFGNKTAEGFDKDLFAFALVDRARLDAIHESRSGMRIGIPLIHGGERFIALMHGNHRTFVKNVEVLVGNNGRHFNNTVHFRLQARHFHVNPNEIVFTVGRIAIDSRHLLFFSEFFTKKIDRSNTVLKAGFVSIGDNSILVSDIRFGDSVFLPPPFFMIVSASFVEHVFVSVTAFFVMMECALTIMQTRSAEKGIHSVPEAFENRMSLASIRKAADYTGDMSQASLLLTVMGAAFALLMTYGQGLTVIAAFTTTFFGPGLTAQWALVAIVLVLMTLIEFPFGWFARFRVKESYGYMRERRLDWLRRSLAETGTGLLYMFPVLAVVLALCEWVGRDWWLALWIVWIGYLFWRWYLTRAESIFWYRRSRPFRDEAVKDFLRIHLERCGYKMADVVIMERPKHWLNSNVMLAGRGKNLTVIIFSHAAQIITAPELLAAVMHEMGHLKHRHGEIRILFYSVLGFLAAWLVGHASPDPAFFAGFGFSTVLLDMTPGNHAGFTIAIGILTFPIFFYPFQPLSNFMTRMMQYQADRYAARIAGPDIVADMIFRLHEDQSETPSPSRLYTLFHYERPRAGMRVAKMKALQKDWERTGQKPVSPIWTGSYDPVYRIRTAFDDYDDQEGNY